jgi:regulator of protease activity HflC (stomatin/prohibitin superfamily)
MKTQDQSSRSEGGLAKSPSLEREVSALNGWLMLVVNLALLAVGIFLLVRSIYEAEALRHAFPVAKLVAGILLQGLGILFLIGHFTLQPNQARVLILFGAYHGTVKQSGFHWANPFYSKGTKVSLRAHNFSTEKVKVNDKRGNPIEIAAVVVWRVQNTAQATFDVEDYEEYVDVQSESAVRHLASSYAYDQGEEAEITLRSNADEVAGSLKEELQQRLAKAGVMVEEARIMHLAYAPEIAQVMLRRQQAEAIIAARQKIVHGAVSMVEMALNDLAAKKVVQLDDERRAAMVSNLLVVLCAESEVTPVVNTGTLYT